MISLVFAAVAVFTYATLVGPWLAERRRRRARRVRMTRAARIGPRPTRPVAGRDAPRYEADPSPKARAS